MLWRNPKDWKWKWLMLQVIGPLGIPIAFSAVAALLWEIGQPGFHVDWKLIVADVTPWALVFFAVALLGSAFHDIWADWAAHKALSISLMVVSGVVLIYSSYTVIWRHTPGYVPGTGVYIFAFILLGASILVCHEAARA